MEGKSMGSRNLGRVVGALAGCLLVAGLVAAGSNIAVVTPVQAQAYVNEPEDAFVPSAYNDQAANVFYSALQPYGTWGVSVTYGRIWRPRHLARDWRPYTYGRWVYTDYGWTWVSSEPWGWACFHYGRWYFDPYQGWIWCPDTEWAPAWVAWCVSGDYIGWAPIPPRVRWYRDRGFDFRGVDLNQAMPPSAFSFCQSRQFLSSDLHRRLVPYDRNDALVRGTSISVNIGVENNRVINRLPVENDRVAQWTGQKITPYRVVDVKTPTSSVVKGDQVRVFRPNVPAVQAGSKPEAAQNQMPARGNVGQTPAPGRQVYTPPAGAGVRPTPGSAPGKNVRPVAPSARQESQTPSIRNFGSGRVAEPQVQAPQTPPRQPVRSPEQQVVPQSQVAPQRNAAPFVRPESQAPQRTVRPSVIQESRPQPVRNFGPARVAEPPAQVSPVRTPEQHSFGSAGIPEGQVAPSRAKKKPDTTAEGQ